MWWAKEKIVILFLYEKLKRFSIESFKFWKLSSKSNPLFQFLKNKLNF